MIDFPAHVLIEGIPAAAVVLSSSYNVLAANKRMERILGVPSDQSEPDPLIGRSITALSIAITPKSKPVLRDWDELFDAAGRQLKVDDATTGIQSNGSLNQLNQELETDHETADFWANEDRKELAMVDVLIYSHERGPDTPARRAPNRIKSRMCIRAISWESDLRYLVTFLRPLAVPHVLSPPHQPVDSAEVCGLVATDGSGSDLQQSRDLAAMISELIPYCMAVADADGQVLFLTQTWYKFTGLSPDDSLGTGWAIAIHPEDISQMLAGWADVLKSNKQHWNYEARYRRADGEYVWFLVRFQATRDHNGVTEKWYASMLDVHEYVLARLKSDHRRQAVMTLLSHADVSLWGMDQAHNIYVREGTLPWDPSQCPMDDNESKDNPVQNNHSKKISSNQLDIRSNLHDLLNDRPFQASLEHQEGDRHYRTRFVADRVDSRVCSTSDTKSTTALGLTIDITETQVRAQLQIDNERLAARNRAALEATELKSRFLANMSHEIRTPIAGVIGLAEILSGTGLNEEQSQLCRDMSNSAAFLLTLVNDILDFSKIEAGHMDLEVVPFKPTSIINILHKLMSIEAKRKNLSLKLVNHLPPDLVVTGDPGRLQQVLTNLLSNAIKFTAVGSVTLTAARLGHEDGASRQPHQPDVTIQFQVEDTGCGIEKQTMAKLFQPFSQADSSTARKFGGTGLGLTISRDLVHLMGGELQLTSVVSKGSKAMLKIPYRKAKSHKPTSHIANVRSDDLLHDHLPSRTSPDTGRDGSELVSGSSSPMFLSHTPSLDASSTQLSMDRRGQLLVLVAEDNSINQRIALLNLKKLGFSAVAVWNGQEVIDYLTRSTSPSGQPQPLPDMILMDCMMPVMDGYRATQIIRKGGENGELSEEIRNIPVIALTASTIKGDHDRCKQAGMSDYMSKPVNQEKLEKMLTKWAPKEK